MFLGIYAITYVLCDSIIFERIRLFATQRSRCVTEMLSCYFCTGFWVSVAVFGAHAVLYYQNEHPARFIFGHALRSLTGAALAYILDVTVGYMLSKSQRR